MNREKVTVPSPIFAPITEDHPHCIMKIFISSSKVYGPQHYQMNSSLTKINHIMKKVIRLESAERDWNSIRSLLIIHKSPITTYIETFKKPLFFHFIILVQLTLNTIIIFQQKISIYSKILITNRKNKNKLNIAATMLNKL